MRRVEGSVKCPGWGLLSLSVSREKSRLSALQILPPLPGQQRAIDPHVAHQHFEAALERFADDFSVLHVLVLAEAHAIRQRPGGALPGYGAELVGHSQSFFIGSDNGREKFAV